MSPRTNMWTLAMVVLLLGGSARGETNAITGRVYATASDDGRIAIPGVRLTLTCGREPPITVIADEQGVFQFSHRSGGSCMLMTTVQGFRAVTVIVTDRDPVDLPIALQQETLYTGLLVTGNGVDGAHQRRPEPDAVPVSAPVGRPRRRPVSDAR